MNMVKALGVITAAITITFLIMTGARAQKVAFFRHNPSEKLDNFKVGHDSTVITARKMAKITVSDLLDYDILYIEGTGPGFAAALAHKAKIALAVKLGLGLYIVGHDPAVFSVAPVGLTFSRPLATREARIPVAAAWHPVSSSTLYEAITRATNGPVQRAFNSLPHGFNALQEVHVGQGRYLPTIIAGRVGHGHVVLRTTTWRYNEANGDSQLALSMTRYLSDGYHIDNAATNNQGQLASMEIF